MLWVGQHRARKIHQVDPESGAILHTVESNRFVTGVTWVDDELWHGTWEGDQSELRRIDPKSGEVLQQLDMPPGVGVSGHLCRRRLGRRPQVPKERTRGPSWEASVIPTWFWQPW